MKAEAAVTHRHRAYSLEVACYWVWTFYTPLYTSLDFKTLKLMICAQRCARKQGKKIVLTPGTTWRVLSTVRRRSPSFADHRYSSNTSPCRVRLYTTTTTFTHSHSRRDLSWMINAKQKVENAKAAAAVSADGELSLKLKPILLNILRPGPLQPAFSLSYVFLAHFVCVITLIAGNRISLSLR